MQFVCASITVVSTIRTLSSWNKVCDKNNNNNRTNKNKKKMSKLRCCCSLVSYLGGVYYVRWGYSYHTAQKFGGMNVGGMNVWRVPRRIVLAVASLANANFTTLMKKIVST